jgi:hypothetical protein
MFNRQPDKNDQLLTEVIDRVLEQLKTEEPETDQYARMNDQLVKLYAIKNENRSRRVSPDTLAGIIANLFGIGIIVGYEQKHIITSKALSFIRKIV